MLVVHGTQIGGGHLHGEAINFNVRWNLSNTDNLGPIKCVLIRELSSQYIYIYEVGSWSSVLIREMSLIQGYLLIKKGSTVYHRISKSGGECLLGTIFYAKSSINKSG